MGERGKYMKPKKTICICFVHEKDVMMSKMRYKEIVTDGTAMIIHRRMDDCDWEFIMIYDI